MREPVRAVSRAWSRNVVIGPHPYGPARRGPVAAAGREQGRPDNAREIGGAEAGCAAGVTGNRRKFGGGRALDRILARDQAHRPGVLAGGVGYVGGRRVTVRKNERPISWVPRGGLPSEEAILT